MIVASVNVNLRFVHCANNDNNHCVELVNIWMEPTRRPLRVLCLHGFRTSGNILRCVVDELIASSIAHVTSS